MRIVIILNNTDLLLDAIERDGDNLTAEVVNGGWTLKILKGVIYCDGKRIEEVKSRVEIPVPNTVRGDYNRVLKWAEKQLVGG
jgi:hypothetical protein